MARFDYRESVGYELPAPSVTSPARRIFVVQARTLAQRGFGLMGAELGHMPEGHGVLIDRCSCVHTLGMRGPIALIWVGPATTEGVRPVISIDSSVPPGRFVAGPRGASGVIETAPFPTEYEILPPCSLDPAPKRRKGADGKGSR